MDRETIDKWLERIILGLVIVTLAYITVMFGGVRPAESALLLWLGAALAALWIIRIWAAPRFRFLLPPVCWAVLPFTVYAVWRYSTSDIEWLARQELIQIIVAVVLLFTVVNHLYGQESIRVLSLSIIFLAMLVSMYGIYQWLTKANTVWGFVRPLAYFGRASGTYICPNHFAAFMEMTLPLAVTMTVHGRFTPLTRIFLGYASFVIFAGIAASQSRAAWFSVALALLVLFWFLIRSRNSRWIAVAFFVLVLAFGTWLYPRSVATRLEATYFTGHERDIRLRLWESAWNMWKDHRWVGVGPDHFDFRYRRYRDAADKTQFRPGRVHNDYLNTLADYGAIGLLLCLLPLGVAAWSLRYSWPHLQRNAGDLNQKKSNRSAIVLGAAMGLVALMFHSFFDFNMHIPANAVLAVLLLAMLSTHVRFATERFWITARWPVAAGATLVLMAAVFLFASQAMKRSRELHLLSIAEGYPVGTTNKIVALKQAFGIEPQNFETAFAIGEHLYALASTGDGEFATASGEAIDWFRRAQTLNRWDPAAYIRHGMCLDWQGNHNQALPLYEKALDLDPNHWQARAMMGWHLFQAGDYALAVRWLDRSIELNWTTNPLAYTYRELSQRMIDANTSPLPQNHPEAAREAVRRALP